MDESLSGAAIASVMVQADWFKLAQQGDAGAIGQILNHQLQPRGVAAKVLHKDDCLKILLIADRPLDQQAFVRFLQQQINRLNIPGLQRVRVYSQKPGESSVQWSQEFIPPAVMASGSPQVPISAMRALNLPALPPQQALSSEYLRSISAAPSRGKIDPSYAASYAQNGAIVRSASPTTSFWQTLRSFQLKTILPYDDILNSDLYRTHAVRLLLFLGLFPLVVNLFAEQAGLAQTAWLLGIYYAAIWGVVLYQIIRPAQFSWGNTLKCTLFTTFIGIPTLLLFQRVPPFNTLYDAVHGDLLARLIGFVLGVGVLEEICKALPVYLLLIRPRRLNDPQTGAFYGAMSGLGFAIAEGAAYSLRYAFGLSRGEIGLGSYMAANTIRFVSLPLFHAILAGIVGYFMGLSVINPSRRGALLSIGLTVAAVLHGCYNTFAGGILGPFIIGLTIVLFVSYLRRSPEMTDEMAQAEQQSRKKP